MMRTTLRLATLVIAPLALGASLTRSAEASRSVGERPAADPTVYRAAVVAPHATHEADEAAHCACVTGQGHPELCGGWVPLVGLYDPDLLDFSELYVWGQQVNTTTEAVADVYRTCGGLGGFAVQSALEGGQTVDEVIDDGYDPLRPVATLRVACAAGYQTGALPLPIPPKALFY